MHTKTLKLLIKDKHHTELYRQARQVNCVWKYINELRSRSIRECGVFLLAFDIHPYTKGASKELGLHSEILKYIASECATRRKQFKKPQLACRKSGGALGLLGWIPDTGAAKFKNGQVSF